MKQDPNEDARNQGGVELPLIQKFINFWYSSSLDLFGGEISSNAAQYFANGLKGRAKEEKFEDHVALEGSYEMELLEDGKLTTRSVPMRNAMNEVLRDGYIDDNQRGVNRWNKTIRECGVDFELKLPSRRFNRKMGLHAGHSFDPEGKPIDAAEFERRRDEWLPSAEDKQYLKRLMQPVLEPGKMANWIAAPARGINSQPLEFEYVRRV
jgi:benzoyl-CoA 2,3-dioxygenase component B